MLRNLLDETIGDLAEQGKTVEDVKFVLLTPFLKCSMVDFCYVAKDIDYDAGYGCAEINNIMIIGDNWWMERAEYDGSEWWEFKTAPNEPEDVIKSPSNIKHFICGGQ